MELIQFLLRPIPPFRLDWTVWALRRRSMNLMDRWDGSRYERAVVIDGAPALLGVVQSGQTLRVTVSGDGLPATARRNAAKAVERLLGIRTDLSDFYQFSSSDRRLNALAMRFRGMKPPRFGTVFEGVVNGITCQQLSLTVGIIILNRLTERYGPAVREDVHAFPRPEDLAGAETAHLQKLGYSGNKARAIINLAKAIYLGGLDLECLVRLDNAECAERLIAIKGVGRWTAEYVLLRALGRVDVFPCDDVGARNSLERWLHLRTKLDYERTRKVLTRWRGYGGVIFLHLLLKGLDDAGKFRAGGEAQENPA